MTAPTLPVSNLINVAVNLSPSAAAAQNLSTLLILGSSDIIDTTERYRIYNSIDAVAADFGTTLPEYLAAVLWFEQAPQPSQLFIGRWAAAATRGWLRGQTLSAAQQTLTNFTAVTAGSFVYAKNGAGPATITGVNLSAATNLPAVAALLTAATAGATVTWNSYYQRFEVESATTGTTSAISFFSTAGAGTDLSGILGLRADSSGAYAAPGAAAETALASVAFFDLNYGQKFYAVTVLGAVNADHLAIAPFINAASNKHIYAVTTQEAASVVASATTDIGYQLAQFGYFRTFVQYSSSNPYSVVSALGRILTTDYGGNNTVITLMYKQEPGIVPEFINVNQAAAIDAKNVNVFAEYNNNTAIIQRGCTSNGVFIDTLIGTDWLALTTQTALYNLLYTSTTKVPQTDAGTSLLVATVESVCAQGVVNGLLAPGVWQTGGFGNLAQGDFLPKGFYVYAPKVATQTLADRAARKAVPIQVAAKLAGAVHTIAMTININA